MLAKYVITGAPGSGKGKVISALRAMGENVRDDVVGYELCRHSGMPWKDAGFQKKVMSLQLDMERRLEAEIPEGRVFLDKGVIDSLVYNIVSGNRSSMMCGQRLMRMNMPYEAAFMLLLPPESEYHAPWTGVESRQAAGEIETMLMDEYRSIRKHGLQKLGRILPGNPEDIARKLVEYVSNYESRRLELCAKESA